MKWSSKAILTGLFSVGLVLFLSDGRRRETGHTGPQETRTRQVDDSPTQQVQNVAPLEIPLEPNIQLDQDVTPLERPREPNILQVTGDVPLEKRLETVLNNLSSRLLESEVARGDYYHLIFEQLKSQGILSGTSSENLVEVGIMTYYLNEKLSPRTLVGLAQDYLTLEPTPTISDEAREDIAAYERFETRVGEYLKQHFGKEPISKDDFERAVQDYVSPKLPDDFANFRKNDISSHLTRVYKTEFNIVPTTRYIGNYSEESIIRAFDKVEAK